MGDEDLSTYNDMSLIMLLCIWEQLKSWISYKLCYDVKVLNWQNMPSIEVWQAILFSQ